MKQNLGRVERKIRFGLGVVITAFGILTLLVNLWLGLFVLGVGLFTAYEGYAGWTAVHVLAEAWFKPLNIYDEVELEA